MTLNLAKVSETYFSKLFNSQRDGSNGSTKAKVLLVDRYTTPVISMSYTQSQLLQHDIILIELIENQHDLNVMKHLNCIVYVKPTKESIQHLTNELKNPHFNSYQLFLNNTINKNQLEKLAEADEFETIQSVIELFQDYVIVNQNLFITQKVDPPIEISKSTDSIVEESNSIISLLLSLKKCPIIKYEQNSIGLKRLSSEILYNINSNSNNNLFDDLNQKSDTAPILLLLDRKNDPITPIITPWTYQSMINELIGIKKNIVNLVESNESVTLSDTQDKFYRESLYLNYGDLTEKFQKYVEQYKSQTKQSWGENLNSQNLSELKKILTKFPEYKKLSANILKHLNLISKLDTEISKRNLWDIGELQQTIICDLDNQQALKIRLLELFDQPNIPTDEKLKLVILYSVRFPNANEITTFIAKLNDPSKSNPVLTVTQNALIKKFKSIVGPNIRSGTSNAAKNGNIGNIFNKKININNLFNNIGHNNPKTDNIYMQYVPRLNDTLEYLLAPTSLQENVHSINLSTLVPDVVSKQYGLKAQNEPVQDIIVYIKGGVTYEEARLVHELSEANPKINLIIGGDNLINSAEWLDSLYDAINESNETNIDGTRTERRAQLRDIL
ncbi:Sec1-like protein [Suhomyces tanzawaensis NRRL Y-17324]|uniref:Sec1-like protein n=1 Tax=Suhomyces tanzawaensis NRRL Y-17324 TaxID=984487 RepID=A0A1E4SCZ4_9ASCO|nr:Sec1-like protein [Suhomyces tanzawaensis NRRL Y-17324]ODV77338.1 Sec1-like protein [Suhomyces tanzawaensis NRRL Y-17324]